MDGLTVSGLRIIMINTLFSSRGGTKDYDVRFGWGDNFYVPVLL